MKKFFLFTLIAFATSAFAQEHPTVTYDGGDLYFVPAKLTSKGLDVITRINMIEKWEI